MFTRILCCRIFHCEDFCSCAPKDADRGVVASFADIASHFKKRVASLVPADKMIQFNLPIPDEPKNDREATAAADALRSFENGKVTAEYLKSIGFRVGCKVRARGSLSDAPSLRIISCSASTMVLHDLSEDEPTPKRRRLGGKKPKQEGPDQDPRRVDVPVAEMLDDFEVQRLSLKTNSDEPRCP